MGQNQGTMHNSGRAGMLAAPNCESDDNCSHIDETNSTVDKLVYLCPGSKCQEGKCQCGSGCKVDPYSGQCCKNFDKAGYCIGTVAPTHMPTHKPMHIPSVPVSSKVCKVPDQMINGVKVSGQQICNLYQTYQ